MQHITPKNKLFPENLKKLAQPPREVYIEGDFANLMDRPKLAVVGSRKATPYGRAVTEQLVRGVAARGVVIVSGLALGIDSIAHQAALDSGGKTIAVLPSGLDNIYPSSHTNLARQILRQKGVLLSEYPPKSVAFKANFIARNRLVAGLSDAILISEAAEFSGSLHTANFALEQGKEVLVVPGPINSPTSVGCNNLIKTGATPITKVDDILNVLHISASEPKDRDIIASSPAEYIILSLIQNGVSDSDELLAKSKLSTTEFQQTISLLEITGRISAVGGNQWTLR